MIDLTLDLDTTDFETLFELGRSLIPATAPGWTDHNTHDPGIMLLELVSWLADAQIYSLARLRRDERKAYGRFVGVSAEGPTPARGLIWPQLAADGTAPWPIGTTLDQQTFARAMIVGAVDFHPEYPLQLTTAKLERLYTRFASGEMRDWTQINARPGVTFMPFGSSPTPKDSLHLVLNGPLAKLPAGAVSYVSLGFELGSTAGLVHSQARRSYSIAVLMSDTTGVRPVTVVQDTTHGLLQSGVLILRIDSASAPLDTRFSLIVKPAGATLLVPPRVRRVALNVLPVIQKQMVVEVVNNFANGFPDQTYTLRMPGLIWGGSAAPVTVRTQEVGQWVLWRPADDLGTCGPTSSSYQIDPEALTITFGNGVNGRMPPAGCSLEVTYTATAGDAGNTHPGQRWQVSSVAGVFGTNTERIGGGSVAQTPDDLRTAARNVIANDHPYVRSDDLTEAAYAMTDLDVVRAEELSTLANAQKTLPGTRVLIALRGREPDFPDENTEPAQWLEAIRARLAPRLPLGQLLRVIPPVYVNVGIQAVLTAELKSDPKQVAIAASARLESSLSMTGNSAWPFGEEISPLSVKAWLRTVPGVARVESVILLKDGVDTQGGSIQLPATGLPLLQLGPADIVVQRPDAGSCS
jgi:hypothetical protein